MQVTTTGFTIAEYCDQMEKGSITINRDYQRSDAVWPPAARSYLIDTILHGFPIPKFCLSQKTDLRSRKTVKEIVDGQQRSKAILDFYENKFRLTGKSEFSGRSYDQLDQGDKQRFISYSISADVFVGATDNEIRQVFRRMNSYTVPLNPQEKRHATHQGELKWFIVEVTERYENTLKSIGVFTEKQLSRMQDSGLLSEIVMTMLTGIKTASQSLLNKFYTDKDAEFPEEQDMSTRIDQAFTHILRWEQIHNTTLMKPFQFFTFFLAISHALKPLSVLNSVYQASALRTFNDDIVLANLGAISEALDAEDPPEFLINFVSASRAGTNTKINREMRFKTYSTAMRPQMLQ